MDTTKVHPRKVKTPPEWKPLQILSKRAKKPSTLFFEEWQAHQGENQAALDACPSRIANGGGCAIRARDGKLAYLDIHEIMAAQKDLVTTLGQFEPKLVKMAPHGERAED